MDTVAKVYKIAEFMANIEQYASDFWDYTFESGSEQGWVTMVKKSSFFKGGFFLQDSYYMMGHFRIIVKTVEWKNCELIKRVLMKLRGKTMKYRQVINDIETFLYACLPADQLDQVRFKIQQEGIHKAHAPCEYEGDERGGITEHPYYSLVIEIP